MNSTRLFFKHKKRIYKYNNIHKRKKKRKIIMQQLNINELKPHPRNNEFFDDMTGDAWEAFKESIKTSGIIEPIVVTKDMIIV